MSTYECILCAVDLTAEADLVIRHGLRLAQQDQRRLHLVHACEHPITGYGELTGDNHMVTEAGIRQAVYPHLETLGQRHGIPGDQWHIEFGRPADVINQLAHQLSADLIAIGSHGRAGIRRLLGSTANSVLHGANCDVLTVRVGQ